MRNLKILSLLVVTILMSSLLLTCQKEFDDQSDYEVTFVVNALSPEKLAGLKSVQDYVLADADLIVLTIVKSDGSATKYTSSEIKIYEINGMYYSQKIVLKTGNYRLSEFVLLDEADSVIFVAPLEGSQEAQNVSDPLPVEFSVTKNTISPVEVEVVSTEHKTPEDFGLNRFPIVEVKTFSFMIGVADMENDQLLAAQLTVSHGSYSYVQELENIANNIVTVKDSLDSYTLTLTKSGYITYRQTYSLDSLYMFENITGNLPLIIELESAIVMDFDGNEYYAVLIGDQVWMTENLKVTHYRNGDALPNVSNRSEWASSINGVYCDYQNYEPNSETYGRLYNWYVTIDNRNVCPSGWHVPSESEYETLLNYCGGAGENAYYEIIPSGSSGFNGILTGWRNNFGDFGFYQYYGYFWTLTEYDPEQAWFLLLGSELSTTSIDLYPAQKACGFPIRCIKD